MPSFPRFGASARLASCRVRWAGPGDSAIVNWADPGDGMMKKWADPGDSVIRSCVGRMVGVSTSCRFGGQACNRYAAKRVAEDEQFYFI